MILHVIDLNFKAILFEIELYLNNYCAKSSLYYMYCVNFMFVNYSNICLLTTQLHGVLHHIYNKLKADMNPHIM